MHLCSFRTTTQVIQSRKQICFLIEAQALGSVCIASVLHARFTEEVGQRRKKQWSGGCRRKHPVVAFPHKDWIPLFIVDTRFEWRHQVMSFSLSFLRRDQMNFQVIVWYLVNFLGNYTSRFSIILLTVHMHLFTTKWKINKYSGIQRYNECVYLCTCSIVPRDKSWSRLVPYYVSDFQANWH